MKFYLIVLLTTLSLYAGPDEVKNALMKGGAFETPQFEITTDYDDYKIYSNIKGLFIHSLNYEGKLTKVFAWYGVPDVAPGTKVPAVLCMHGAGGEAFPEWVKKWNDRGYAALAFDLYGQVPPNNATHAFSGPVFKTFFTDMEKPLVDHWMFHAAGAAVVGNSLLRSFPEVDSTKIGITGISWGGGL